MYFTLLIRHPPFFFDSVYFICDGRRIAFAVARTADLSSATCSLKTFLMTESGQSIGRGKPNSQLRARHRVDDCWRGPFPVAPVTGC